MSVGQAFVTAEEFKQIAHDHDGLVELVRGEVVKLQRTGARHGVVCVQIAVPLLEWVKQVHGGYVMTNNVGIQTQQNPDTVRGPDVIFVRKSRFPDGLSDGDWLGIAPDLCIEVLSTHDHRPELVAKLNEFFQLGVPEVWTLDPETREVQIHLDPHRFPTTLRDGDTLTSERLPGFACAVSDLFEGC
jgi:Uma2 family endonuclease